jgi:signal transduction histidine kinase
VSLSEDGTTLSWLDGAPDGRKPSDLPVWVYALSRVAVEARRAIVSDRLGQQSRFAEEPGVLAQAQAAIVPLPRTSKAGQAIIAVAPAGQTIAEAGFAVLDAVAATLAESLHMQAAENARAESAVKSRVMAAVSHEMRNPLNSILGFTGLVLDASDGSLTDKQRRQLGFVHSSANTMLTLVNNYLDLAKLRSGAMTMQYEVSRIANLIGDVAATMQVQADGKNVTIRTSVAPDATARIDPVRLRQVLTNLLSNAIKFTPPGGRVYVRGRADATGFRLAVSDTGVGIPKEQQRQLFTEFSKIDAGTMAAAKGTGLGLALSQAFVQAMGGRIHVYSRRGRGTTFVVLLPNGAAPERQVSAA